MTPRRGLLAGLGALLAAPAIIRTPGLLMPVRPVLAPPRQRLVITSITVHDGGLCSFTLTPAYSLAPGDGYVLGDALTLDTGWRFA